MDHESTHEVCRRAKGVQALARLQQPDVPDLRDSSTIGGLCELYGTIVKHSGYCVRSLKPSSFELTAGVVLHHYLVSDLVGVVLAGEVLPLVVLKGTVLFPFLDILPILQIGDVEQGVTTKH